MTRRDGNTLCFSLHLAKLVWLAMLTSFATCTASEVFMNCLPVLESERTYFDWDNTNSADLNQVTSGGWGGAAKDWADQDYSTYWNGVSNGKGEFNFHTTWKITHVAITYRSEGSNTRHEAPSVQIDGEDSGTFKELLPAMQGDDQSYIIPLPVNFSVNATNSVAIYIAGDNGAGEIAEVEFLYCGAEFNATQTDGDCPSDGWLPTNNTISDPSDGTRAFNFYDQAKPRLCEVVNASCPEFTTGNRVAFGCTVNDGYSGTVTPTSVDPFYNSTVAAVACPALSAVANSGLSSAVTLYTTDTETVTCNDGYATSGGETSFTVSCDASGAGASSLNGEESCVAVACPALSAVANSDLSSAVTLSTTDTETVTCNNGYATSGGDTSFTVSCDASGAGESSLNGEESCVVVSCPTLSVNNSNAGSITNRVTGDEVLVRCESGFYSSEGVNQTATCVGTAPGENTWTVSPCQHALSLEITVEGLTMEVFEVPTTQAALQLVLAETLEVPVTSVFLSAAPLSDAKTVGVVISAVVLYATEEARDEDYALSGTNAFKRNINALIEEAQFEDVSVIGVVSEKPNAILSAAQFFAAPLYLAYMNVALFVLVNAF